MKYVSKMMRKSKDNLWGNSTNWSKKEGNNFNNKTNNYIIINNNTKNTFLFIPKTHKITPDIRLIYDNMIHKSVHHFM